MTNRTKIYLAQVKCSQNHCIAAVAGPAKSPEDAADIGVKMMAAFERARSEGVLNRKCDICQSTNLRVHVAATIYRTMEEARGPLAAALAAQMETA